MTISKFSFERLEALVDFVEERSNWGALGRDLGRQTVSQGANQPGLDPRGNCWLIEHRGRVRGFCLVNREPSMGRAVLQMDVDPAFAGSPLEKGLLETALDSCRGWQAGLVHLCLPEGSQLISLLVSMGFSQVRTYSVMAWNEKAFPGGGTIAGFQITSFSPGDEALLTQVQNEVFRGSWGFCPNTVDQIGYRTNMANSPHNGILFLRKGDKTAGYCWTCVVPSSTGIRGRIAMMGVVPEFRGQGLSHPILEAGMYCLGSQGVQDISLEVDSDNMPAVRLYTSTGFRQVSTLHWFELPLA